MATINLTSRALEVRFTWAERIAGLLRDVEIPVQQIRAVTVEPDGLEAVRGLRAPGLAIPKRRKVGTWRGRGRKSLVSVRAGQPALRVELAGARFDQLIIGTDDAAGQATDLTGRMGQSG